MDTHLNQPSLHNMLVVAHRVPFPPNKGEKLRTYYQIKYLVSAGYKVTVYTLAENQQDRDHALALAENLGIKVEIFDLSWRPLRLARALFYGKSFSQTNFYTKSMQIQMVLKMHTFDVILCTASSLVPYIKKLNVDPSKPLLRLIDFMDVDSDKWLQYAKESSWPKSWVYAREAKLVKALESIAIDEFDTQFLIAEAERQLFHRTVRDSKHLKVLGNGIDAEEFTPDPVGEKDISSFTFFFAGVMDYKPNVDAVLWFVENCWPTIKASLPSAKLVVGGMNPVDEIEALGHKDGISITGFVEDIVPFFQKADVFIAPFQIARGVQNKVLQAMSVSLPVISTPLGAEGIDCEHNKNIFIASYAEEFTECCLRLSKEPSTRKTVGQNARELILNRYAWESVLAPLFDSLKTFEDSISFRSKGSNELSTGQTLASNNTENQR